MSPHSNKRIACWMSDKKSQKFDWKEFEGVCRNYGYEIFNLDLNAPINVQTPIHVILHKLTDVIVSAEQGNAQDSERIRKIEEFIKQNPSVIVIDPIENVRRLIGRHVCYKMIRSTGLCNYGIFTPNFCELNSENVESIKNALKNASVTFPFICKPIWGHGSKRAHEMSIIFNEKQLAHCKVPCVAQSFINHNAILYKLFLVKTKYYFVERPSLKNFHDTTDIDVINFRSGDVSKAGAQNDLCVLDSCDVEKIVEKFEPDSKIFDKIVQIIHKEFGMDLLGVDVVVSNRTRRYAIIDVNVFPGYDGFPNFLKTLIECIDEKFTNNEQNKTNN